MANTAKTKHSRARFIVYAKNKRHLLQSLGHIAQEISNSFSFDTVFCHFPLLASDPRTFFFIHTQTVDFSSTHPSIHQLIFRRQGETDLINHNSKIRRVHSRSFHVDDFSLYLIAVSFSINISFSI